MHELQICFPTHDNSLNDLIRVIVFGKDISILKEYDDFEFAKTVILIQQYNKHISKIGYANSNPETGNFIVLMSFGIFREISGKELDFIQSITDRNR